MTDKLNEPQRDDDRRYEQWLAARREVCPPADLADRVMGQVNELESQRHDEWWLRLAQQIEHSRAARWSVCGGALAVGILPFLFFIYVPSF